MDLGFFPTGDPEKDLKKKLKSFAGEIEHKFQQRRGHDIDIEFVDKIHDSLQKLDKATNNHELKNKINRLDTTITAAKLYRQEGKYEEYIDRVKVIADKLNDLDDESSKPTLPKSM